MKSFESGVGPRIEGPGPVDSVLLDSHEVGAVVVSRFWVDLAVLGERKGAIRVGD